MSESKWIWPGLALLIAAAYFVGKGTGYTSQTDPKQDLMVSCAKQAQVVLDNARRDLNLTTDSVSVSNHYNSELNKCLARVQLFMQNGTGGLIISDYVEDAFEGKTLLSCNSGTSTTEWCFVPAISSITGKPVSMNLQEGQSKLAAYMKN